MRIAVIADIHGNLPAFEAVMKDIASRGLEGVVHLGDLVGHGPRPNEVVAAVKAQGITGVVGNYDLAVLGEDARQSAESLLKKPLSQAAWETFLWTREHTSEESREFLKALPAVFWIEEGSRKIAFVHGSTEFPNEYLYPDTPQARFKELLDRSGADVLFAGHTHLPMARAVDGRLVVNPGSVGKPKDGDPRASYLIVDTEDGLRLATVRVTFDVESVANDCVESGLPKELAEALRQGL